VWALFKEFPFGFSHNITVSTSFLHFHTSLMTKPLDNFKKMLIRFVFTNSWAVRNEELISLLFTISFEIHLNRSFIFQIHFTCRKSNFVRVNIHLSILLIEITNSLCLLWLYVCVFTVLVVERLLFFKLLILSFVKLCFYVAHIIVLKQKLITRKFI